MDEIEDHRVDEMGNDRVDNIAERRVLLWPCSLDRGSVFNLHGFTSMSLVYFMD